MFFLEYWLDDSVHDYLLSCLGSVLYQHFPVQILQQEILQFPEWDIKDGARVEVFLVTVAVVEVVVVHVVLQ